MKELVVRTIKKKIEEEKKKWILILAVIGIAVVGVIGAILFFNREKPETPPEIKVSIDKIIEKNQLNTISFPVEGVATVMDKKGKHVKYHVAYTSYVTAGIDNNKIEIQESKPGKEGEKGKVIIKLPDAEYTWSPIDQGSMEYMFLKNKYEVETVSAEANKACKEDLKKYLATQNDMLEIARENAIKYIELLLQPFAEKVNDQYTIVVQ